MASEEVVQKAVCVCCGMREDCTVGYMGTVQQRFGGVWVCGLCEEAIKDEERRLGVNTEIALRVHATFRETATLDPTIHMAESIIQLIKKVMTSVSSSPM